jgi:hypothetical protein
MSSVEISAPAAQAATTPRTVNVQVVPEYPGVQFTLDGIPAVTGSGGRVTVPDPNLTDPAQNLVLNEQQLGPTLRVSLDRVQKDPNHGAFSRNLVVELDADSAVTINLLTPQRKELPLTEVESVTLNDSLGRTTRISPTQLRAPVWLASSRPSKVTDGVSSRLVTYSVKSVMVRGTNVVNSGQLRFTTANHSLTWNVPVILHSLTVVGDDLLAAKPAGTSVRLTYPNGTVQTIPFGPHHRVTLSDLPRGSYGVKVLGGLVPLASTVRLSRDQAAAEIVVTAGDMVEIVAILLAMLAVIVAAGIIGRRRRHSKRQREGEADATLA